MQLNILPDVVKNLLIINALAFFATYVLEGFGIDLIRLLALHYPGSSFFEPYQIVSHMFMHGSLLHLFTNMFALWMFGSVLENYWGPGRFLFFYLFTGLGAAFIHSSITYWEISRLEEAAQAYMQAPSPESFLSWMKDYGRNVSLAEVDKLVFNWQQNAAFQNDFYANQTIGIINNQVKWVIDIPTVGASGAVFGLLLAFGMMFPNQVILLYFFIPMKAKYFVTFFALFELYAGFTSLQGGSNIAHFAHLGGMLFGIILIRYWRRSG